MKTKLIAVLGILALLTAMLPIAVSAAPPIPDYKPVDVGPELRTWDASPNRIQGGLAALTPAEANAKKVEAMAALAGTPYQACAVDAKSWLSLDDFNGAYFFTTFYLVSETAGSELWVQADLSYPVDDPRATPEISCEQADYLLSEFDNNMYPTEVSFFGAPDSHDGSAGLLEAWGIVPPGYYSNSAGRQVVLVSNVRDDAFYDYTYPNYIAGFYSSTFEAYFDRNIMSIDSHDWANRVGPDGSRPHLYEGVFAHEYQHLLHDDYDSDEENFINEGLSMFAEFLTGYAEGNDAYSTFEALPENSLTAWGDQGGREIVSDYGLTFLWHMYLYEHFGAAYIQEEFHNPLNGISGINSSLSNTGNSETFDEVFHDFAVATVIDSDMNGYQYGFENHDVNLDLGNKGNTNPDAYDLPGAPPWGSDYYVLGGVDSLAGFEFNGVRFNPDWSYDGDVWYSGDGDLLDNWAIFEATGVTATSELTFDTYWDIEDNWDFGFVQVSTDNGANWTSLSNAYTSGVIDPQGHPDIAANLPGLTSWSCYVEADCWVNMSFDLSAYDGQDILIAFRFMTDWGFTYEGWYVDNVFVDGTEYDDFVSYAEFSGIENLYTVTLVGERTNAGEQEYAVETILSDDYMGSVDDFKYILDDYNTVYMLVTFDAPEGATSYADYSFEFLSGGNKPFKNKVR
jgi:hypothetical protein